MGRLHHDVGMRLRPIHDPQRRQWEWLNKYGRPLVSPVLPPKPPRQASEILPRRGLPKYGLTM